MVEEHYLGLLQPGAVTVKTIQVARPILVDSTVDLVSVDGDAFTPVPGELPLRVTSGTAFALAIECDSSSGGGTALDGEMVLHVVGDNGLDGDVVLELDARVESPTLKLADSSVELHAVRGEHVRTVLYILNPNEATPVEIEQLDITGDYFSLDEAVLAQPILIAPQGVYPLDIFFDASEGVDSSGHLTVSHSAGPPLSADLTGTVHPDVVEMDLGTVPIDPVTFESPTLTFDVGGLATSFQIEIDTGDWWAMFPSKLERLDGYTLIDERDPWDSRYLWWRNIPGDYDFLYYDAALQLPNTDRPEVNLRGARTSYDFQFLTNASSARVRVVVKQSATAEQETGYLPLNVFFSAGHVLTPATAGSDPKMQEILRIFDQIFAQVGIRLGDVDYYKLTDPTYDDISTYEEQDALMAQSAMASEVRLNLFFVNTIGDNPSGSFSPLILGIAGAIPGQYRNGTIFSGVMCAWDDWDVDTIGSTAAHECGHYLGLFHPVESDGVTTDLIDDTPVCPLSGTSAECTREGDANLMWYLDLGFTTRLTDGQGLVLHWHPLVRAGTSSDQLFPDPPSPALLAGVDARLQGRADTSRWCANCALVRRNGAAHR